MIALILSLALNVGPGELLVLSVIEVIAEGLVLTLLISVLAGRYLFLPMPQD